MGLKWTRKMTKLIIYLLHRNVCLWDINNAHYAIQASRQEALISITKEIAKIDSRVTITDVRSKIHTLRSQYRKEYNMLEQSKRELVSGKIYEYPRNTLWCFDRLNFLMPVMERKGDVSHDNAKLSVSDEDNSSCLPQKERRKNQIWFYFDRTSEHSACCKLCKAILSYKQTTSPLARHLYTRHQIDTSYNGAEKSRFLKSQKELRMLDAKLKSDKQNTFEGSNLDPIEFMDSEEEFLIVGNTIDDATEQQSNDEMSNFEYQIIENNPNNQDHVEQQPSTNRSSQDNDEPLHSQIHKLKAETRYYNEMADLAQAKRILIGLQTEKLRLELNEMYNS